MGNESTIGQSGNTGQVKPYRMHSEAQVFMRPVDSEEPWQEVGMLEPDGYRRGGTFDTAAFDDTLASLTALRDPFVRELTITAYPNRQILGLVFGIYRAMGRGPLIRKGGKP